MSNPASLWRHRDFTRLWAAETVSKVGTQVTFLALPLTAVVTLDASAFEVGVLTACETAAFLLVGLPAGALVDRVRRRPVLIGTDIGRALVLATVPLAAVLGVLTMAQLYVVALLTGLLTVFFDVAYQSYLPALVTREQLVDGNAKLGASESVAQIAGPGLGGALVQALTAPYALLLDAVSYLASAGFLVRIRRDEARPEVPAGGRSLRREIGEGLRFVLGSRLLWAIAGCTSTFNFFSGISNAVLVLFFVRELDLSPATIGLLFSVSSAGGIAGAVTAGWISRRVGAARTIIYSVLFTAPFGLLLPLAQPGWGVAVVVVSQFVVFFGVVVYNATQLGFRQALCPPRLLGRMNATMRFLVWGTLPLGGLAGGALGSLLGLRPALWVAAAGGTLAGLWVVLSPMRGMRDMPVYEEPAAPAERAGAATGG